MVKKENKKVMITCTPKMIEYLEVLQDYYDMSKTEVIKLLITKEFKERSLR